MGLDVKNRRNANCKGKGVRQKVLLLFARLRRALGVLRHQA